MNQNNLCHTLLRIPSNPDWLTKGDTVLFIARMRNGKKILHIGEVVKGYTEGFEVKDIKTGKIYFPYSQDTFLINDGVEVMGVKPTLEFTSQI